MDPNANPPGMFQDPNGKGSYLRVMSFCSFLMACVTAILMYLKPPADVFIGLWTFTGFLIGGFVPQALGKFAENLNLLRK